MSQITMQAQLKKVTLRGRNDGDGIVAKRLRIFMSREFDDEIAAALGNDARGVLASLRGRGLTRAVLPTTAINVQCTITGNNSADDRMVIPTITGVTAIGKWAGSDDDVPTMLMEFDTAYDRAVLMFLADHYLNMVTVELQPRQTELPLAAETNGQPDDKPAGTGGRKRGEKSAEAHA
jgi:hypothetical protein